MAAIPRRLGEAGAHLAKGSGSPDLLTILDEIADDIATIRTAIGGGAVVAAVPAAIALADLVAIAGGESPTEAEHNLVLAMANDCKAKTNALRAWVLEINDKLEAIGALKTTKAAGI